MTRVETESDWLCVSEYSLSFASANSEIAGWCGIDERMSGNNPKDLPSEIREHDRQNKDRVMQPRTRRNDDAGLILINLKNFLQAIE